MASRHPIEQARAVRSAKAAALARVETGECALRSVLVRPQGALGTCDLYEVLLRTPNLNHKGARRVCQDASIWPHVKLAELTRRERGDVLRALPKRVK